MIAQVEQEDGSYVSEDRGKPDCGTDFCDRCGDCLDCYPDTCGEDSGPHMWVIYHGI